MGAHPAEHPSFTDERSSVPKAGSLEQPGKRQHRHTSIWCDVPGWAFDKTYETFMRQCICGLYRACEPPSGSDKASSPTTRLKARNSKWA